jgi:hypothetical protein
VVDTTGHVPTIAWTDFAFLITDRQEQAARQQQAELFLRVTVHLVLGTRRKNCAGEVHLFAVQYLKDIAPAQIGLLISPAKDSLTGCTDPMVTHAAAPPNCRASSLVQGCRAIALS